MREATLFSVTLNESPSEKEGKSTVQQGTESSRATLNESPSEKEGIRKGREIPVYKSTDWPGRRDPQ